MLEQGRALVSGATRALHWAMSRDREHLRRIAGWLVTFAIVAWIVIQLRQIGWVDVWRARPDAWQFYALCLVSYVVLPIADVLIFRRLWGLPFWPSLGPFLRKRVLNSAFVGYSGEIFLLVWARSRVALADTRLAHDIKDSNILSAAVSTLVTAGLIAYFVADGAWRQFRSGGFEAGAALTMAFAVGIPLLLVFRGKLLRLDGAAIARIGSIHAGRFALIQLLTLAQWHFALPESGWSTLVTLLTLQLMVSRLPLVPNRDVLFIGVALSLSGPLMLGPDRIASLLVLTNAIQLALHLAVMAATATGTRPFPAVPAR